MSTIVFVNVGTREILVDGVELPRSEIRYRGKDLLDSLDNLIPKISFPRITTLRAPLLIARVRPAADFKRFAAIFLKLLDGRHPCTGGSLRSASLAARRNSSRVRTFRLAT